MWVHLCPLLCIWVMEATGLFLQFLLEDNSVDPSEMWDATPAGAVSGSSSYGGAGAGFWPHLLLFVNLCFLNWYCQVNSTR